MRESEERRLAEARKAEEERRSENPLASFRRGDPSLAIESMYEGLSMDIEKLRDDILQELRYTYKQDMAIYDDLSSLIESAKKTDRGALEESLRPLQEKLDTLAPVDYEKLADSVAEKVIAGGIDYDVLAHHIAEIMRANEPAEAALPAPAAEPAADGLAAMERKIDDLQNILQGAVSVKQMPEFQKLDRLIAEFLQTQSYEFIPDILVAADAAKNTANRYIVTATPCAAKPCFRTSAPAFRAWS